jgi:hypothetical protein
VRLAPIFFVTQRNPITREVPTMTEPDPNSTDPTPDDDGVFVGQGITGADGILRPPAAPGLLPAAPDDPVLPAPAAVDGGGDDGGYIVRTYVRPEDGTHVAMAGPADIIEEEVARRGLLPLDEGGQSEQPPAPVDPPVPRGLVAQSSGRHDFSHS